VSFLNFAGIVPVFSLFVLQILEVLTKACDIIGVSGFQWWKSGCAGTPVQKMK